MVGRGERRVSLKVEVKFLRLCPRNRLQIIEEEQIKVRRKDRAICGSV